MALSARTVEDPAARIQRLLKGQAPQFSKAFEDAVAHIRSKRTLKQIADLLQAGRFEEALDGVQQAAGLLGDAYGTVLSNSARAAAAFMGTALDVTVSFDQTNLRAVAAMSSSRLRLIREFSAEQRTATRQALARGTEQGLNPVQQAKAFRDSIGLTAKQEQAVANYRALLQNGDAASLDRALRDKRADRTVTAALRDAKTLSPERIDSMVARYRQNYITYRSNVIARTEALRAVHEGTEEMYSQAIDQGLINPRSLLRKWVTAHDSRVRDSHAHLDGVQHPLGVAWQGLNGLLRYPGDPGAPASETVQCRCVLTTVMTFADDESGQFAL